MWWNCFIVKKPISLKLPKSVNWIKKSLKEDGAIPIVPWVTNQPGNPLLDKNVPFKPWTSKVLKND